jgi:hypothetical protein
VPGNTNPEETIYTAVNLDLYMTTNPEGFLDGEWEPGDNLQSLGVSIVNGEVSGLEGILWATSEFTFDPLSATGWVPTIPGTLLNSAAYPNLWILAQHENEGVTASPVAERVEGLLLEAWPNPFTASTSIRYVLPASGVASLRVYDVDGRLVRELLKGEVRPGARTTTWDGRDSHGSQVSAGVYFVRLQAPDLEASCRVVLTR